MKIKTALTLKNTGVIAVVFLLCMTLIYLVSEHIRSNTFFHNLKSEAVTKVHLFLQNQVDADIMQSIYLNNKEFINEVEVAVYTTDFHMLYHDAIDNDIVKENPEMIAQILQQKEIEFYIGKYQAVGMVYPFNGQTYIVTAAAYDGYGHTNLLEPAGASENTGHPVLYRPSSFIYYLLFPGSGILKTYPGNRKRSRNDYRFTH